MKINFFLLVDRKDFHALQLYGQYLVFRCMGKDLSDQKNMKNYKITDFQERISRKLYKISKYLYLYTFSLPGLLVIFPLAVLSTLWRHWWPVYLKTLLLAVNMCSFISQNTVVETNVSV